MIGNGETPKLLEVLSVYWWEARPKEWLFPGDIAGQAITRHSVEMACQAAWRRSGLSKPVTPHSLRHATKADCVGSALEGVA